MTIAFLLVVPLLAVVILSYTAWAERSIDGVAPTRSEPQQQAHARSA